MRNKRLMIDTLYGVETPEGVELELRPAGPLVRLLAWNIDFGIRVLFGIICTIPLSLLGQFGFGILFLIMFILEWFYPVLFEVLSKGSTPGKKAMGLVVIHRDGTPVGWDSSIIRNLLRVADFLPIAYGCGLCAMLFSDGFQRLGDLAAGTLVVYQPKKRLSREIPTNQPRPSPLSLDIDEQRSVISFGQRAGILPPDRAQELASICQPLVDADPRPNRDAVSFLADVAAWLVGKRASSNLRPRNEERA